MTVKITDMIRFAITRAVPHPIDDPDVMANINSIRATTVDFKLYSIRKLSCILTCQERNAEYIKTLELFASFLTSQLLSGGSRSENQCEKHRRERNDCDEIKHPWPCCK